MTMIPAFGPWAEHPADADEEKRLTSAQQSKTSPISIDREHETGVFYGSGKDPYQTSLASCTCNDFVKQPIRQAAVPANGTKRSLVLPTALNS